LDLQAREARLAQVGAAAAREAQFAPPL